MLLVLYKELAKRVAMGLYQLSGVESVSWVQISLPLMPIKSNHMDLVSRIHHKPLLLWLRSLHATAFHISCHYWVYSFTMDLTFTVAIPPSSERFKLDH